MAYKSPLTLDGSPVSPCLYVDDVDAVYAKALALGATTIGEMSVKDQFYGDRSGRLEDPFGHVWLVSTHIEDVAPDEMQKRMEAQSQKQSSNLPSTESGPVPQREGSLSGKG